MPGSVPQIPGVKCGEQLAHTFRHEVARLLNRQSSNFPGAQPVSFARHHLAELCRQDYYLCEKTDGIRCLLYCTVDEKEQEIHYLIDRKNDYYFVTGLHFPHHEDESFQAFHKDTILDGELVVDTEKNGEQQLRYLVFDCMAMDGECLVNRSLDKRFARLETYIQKPFDELYKKFPTERAYLPFDVQIKSMEKPYVFKFMFSQKLPTLCHGNDGLVFTCKNTPYVSGTDTHILKWKPAHENSIDFKLVLGDFPQLNDELGMYEDYDAQPSISLHIYHGGSNYQYYADLFYTSGEWESMKVLGEQLDGRIIECYRDAEGRWRFKKEENGAPRFRDDKTTANHVSTVLSVIESIEDAVSEEDLLAAEPRIRAAWKKRHPEETRPTAQRPAPVNGQQQITNGH